MIKNSLNWFDPKDYRKRCKQTRNMVACRILFPAKFNAYLNFRSC